MSGRSEVADLRASKDAIGILGSMIGHRVRFVVFDGYVPAACWMGSVPLECVCGGVGVEHWVPQGARRPQANETAFAYVSGRAPKAGALSQAALRRLVVYPRLPVGLKAIAYRQAVGRRGTFLKRRLGLSLGPGAETLVRVDVFDFVEPADEEEETPAVVGDEGIRFSFSGGHRLNLRIGAIGAGQVILTPGGADSETFRGRQPRLSLS